MLFPFSDMPASGMYFLTYEYFKKLITKTEVGEEKASKFRVMLGTIFAGGMAGICECKLS